MERLVIIDQDPENGYYKINEVSKSKKTMKQQEIIKYYEDNGGLRCKDWTLNEIKEYIKSDLGKQQRVYQSTCRELKRTAEIYQR